MDIVDRICADTGVIKRDLALLKWGAAIAIALEIATLVKLFVDC